MSSLSIQIGHGDNPVPVASNPSGDIEVVTTSIKEDNFALEDNQDDLVSVEDEYSVSVDNTWAETTTKGEKKKVFSPNKCLIALGFLALFGTALTAGTAVGSSKAFKSMNAAAAPCSGSGSKSSKRGRQLSGSKSAKSECSESASSRSSGSKSGKSEGSGKGSGKGEGSGSAKAEKAT